MNTLCKIYRLSILVLLLVVTFIAPSGCAYKRTEMTEEERKSSHTLKYYPGLRKIVQQPIPLYSEAIELFIGDVADSRAPEIVITGEGFMRIYDCKGNLKTECVFNGEAFDPALLYDYDGDGKLDIFFGSTSSEDLSIRIINGRGNSIHRFGFPSQEFSFASVHPQFVSNEILFIVARELWADFPRGVIAAELPDFSLKWIFLLPSDPIKLTKQSAGFRDNEQGDVYTISHLTRHTGQFPRLGIKPDRLAPGDNAIRLFQTNNRGETVEYRELSYSEKHTYRPLFDSDFPVEPPLSGKGEFFPLGLNVEDPLFLVQTIVEDDPNAPYFYVHLIEESGVEISHTTGPFWGTLADIRLLPEVLLLWDSRDPGNKKKTRRVDIFEPASLEYRNGKEFVNSKSAVTLGPVIETVSTGGDTLFVSSGETLMLLDADLNELGTWPASGPRWLDLLEAGGSMYLVGAGKMLEIWKIK